MSHAALRERQGSVAERAALAADATTAPELLTWLAADPAPQVRAAVAANSATPPQAGLLLVEDAEADVREALARRIGRLAPGLDAPAQGRPGRMTGAILARLVEDAAVAVRAALSEAVAGLPDAPRTLILRLAQDTELDVAAPVLRLSPLLRDEDLLALVAAPPAAFTRRIVAGRAQLAEPVAEAIAATADAPAIAALLGNASAAIREATLDRLAEQSAGQAAWQAALVRRPRLPPGAARALGAIIAAHLLQALAARPDLPAGLAETLQPRIEAHLAAAAASEAAARDAARSGDRDALAEVLTSATGYPPGRIEAALALRSPRAIVALCWRAGWTAELAEEVQVSLGVPRAKAVRANVEGSWTLSPAELQWQVELLEELPE
ncbi:DUF2336 domain-containing protein [Roseomonas sp. AR75]|uniref:DUF2336 domain-containing protein n=1 Tax=Roseomonas sp. AR75 TaxID=2562311 RepID=UPI0010BFEA53|nr:DUF2336 domain-containing protein [Roseomonas sp. AR75]